MAHWVLPAEVELRCDGCEVSGWPRMIEAGVVPMPDELPEGWIVSSGEMNDVLCPDCAVGHVPATAEELTIE